MVHGRAGQCRELSSSHCDIVIGPVARLPLFTIPTILCATSSISGITNVVLIASSISTVDTKRPA